MKKLYNYSSCWLDLSHTTTNYSVRASRLLPIICLLLVIMSLPQSLGAQTNATKPLQGVVVNEAGQAMVGVTVIVPKTTQGVNTDSKGSFRILVARSCDSLQFSYIGYVTKTVSVRDVQLVKMVPDVASIEAVVMTGIFARKAESFTGAAVTISGSDLKRVGNRNVFQSLKSLDPSLNIMSSMTAGSDPNSMPDMQMRGASTFPGGTSGSELKGNYLGNPNAPLFILDGFETTMERVFDMDMNRISSVTILKDASAKAIYGAKAANGVVVIETIPLLSNQTRITYQGNISLEMPDLTSYNLCNALEKLQVEKYEGLYEETSGDRYAKLQQTYNRRLESALAGNDTYWLSKPLRIGVGQKHTLTVEMGENAVKALANFSYNNVEGAMKGSRRNTVEGTLSLSYRYKKWLFRDEMNISNTKSNDSPYGKFSTYAQMNPYWTPYAADGSLNRLVSDGDKDGSKFSNIANPLYDASLNTLLQQNNLYYSNNFYAEVEAAKGLKLIAKMGISGTRLDTEDFYPSAHSKFINYTAQEDLLRKGSYEMSLGKSSIVDGKFDLQYSTAVGKHNFFGNLHFDISESLSSETTFLAEGFPSDRMNNISFARQYAQGQVPQSFDMIRRNISLMAFLAYNYDDRFLIDGTINRSGASSFGSNNKWGTFWSIAGAWNIHNEKFMDNITGLNNLRLRASYGSTGNPNMANNNSYALYKYVTTGQYDGFIGAILQNMENPNLKWQQKDEYNFGLDLAYKGLTLSVDYYDAYTRNLVTDLSIAPSTGFMTVSDNLGEVRNRGFEVKASYRVWSNKDGFVLLNGAITTNKNYITRLSESMNKFNELQNDIAAKMNNSKPVLRYIDGMPLNAIWAVPSLGIDPMTGKEVYVKQDGTHTYTWSASDMVYCGKTDPNYNGTLGFSAEYKGVGLSMAATFVGGRQYYNSTLVDRIEDADILYNVDRRVLSGRWLKPGQHAQFSALRETYDENGQGQFIMASRPSSRFVQKNNEMALTSISAYYDFRQKLIRKVGMKQLRLTFYMNDLTTLSTIRIERGTSYPFARNMSFSLTGTF